MNNLPSPFKSPKGEAEYMAAYEVTMRLWTVPYEDMYIPSRFGSTHLVICGPKDAPPLVLLHSFFSSLTNWAYNIADLSRHFRVYALDMMGQPSKSIPDQPIRTREEMAEWLTGILDALRISETHLGGYSYGGFAALNYAIHAPDRIKKLVLLTPVGGLVPLKTQFYIRSLATSYLPTPSLKRLAMKSFMDWTFYKPNLRNENTRRMFDCMVDQMTLGNIYFRMGTIVLPVPYKDEELRGVRNPTLLLIGQQEAYYDPVAAVERAKQMIPNIQTELIPEANHDMPVSQYEAVDRRILEFLKE
jgi:pimeloyl-ACP methyl ester carboxylesterase